MRKFYSSVTIVSVGAALFALGSCGVPSDSEELDRVYEEQVALHKRALFRSFSPKGGAYEEGRTFYKAAEPSCAIPPGPGSTVIPADYLIEFTSRTTYDRRPVPHTDPFDPDVINKNSKCRLTWPGGHGFKCALDDNVTDFGFIGLDAVMTVSYKRTFGFWLNDHKFINVTGGKTEDCAGTQCAILGGILGRSEFPCQFGGEIMRYDRRTDIAQP